MQQVESACLRQHVGELFLRNRSGIIYDHVIPIARGPLSLPRGTQTLSRGEEQASGVDRVVTIAKRPQRRVMQTVRTFSGITYLRLPQRNWF